jgi:hypothetical protein
VKAMRGRIALPKHFVQNAKRTLFGFVPRSRDFWSAHSLPARVRASSRRFSGVLVILRERH